MSTTIDQPDRRALLKNALVALDEMQTKLDRAERAKTEPIAVVGMSCRFPGGANNPELYWQLLREGRDAVTTVPIERWGTTSSEYYGGFIDQIDGFDPQFFGISPREANTVDPQQRLVLEVGWEALENAGIAPDSLVGSQTGVFIGVTTNDYLQVLKQGGPSQMDVYTATGSALNVIAGRVSYILGLHGPAISVDTACSSSLVAIHLACQSLRTGESNLAITGGVNALLTQDAFTVFQKWGMMSSDGRCKTFDAAADGFVRAEGCGVLVLKRLSDAQANGDTILAVIRGSAVNHDGHSSGLTVPNGLAQEAVVRQAVTNAHVNPADVSYVEAHGTGTALGDPIEVEALGAVLGEGRTADQPLTIGSVKTNIGHPESASGVAGIIKTILSLNHREIPPHLHFHERSPRIPWPDFTIQIPTEVMPWETNGKPRIAGVSSFGFSGTNAHVVLEEAPVTPAAAPQENPAPARPAHVLALSGRSANALRDVSLRYVDYLAAHPDVDLADVAFNAQTGRAHFNHRLALVAESVEQAQAQLAAFTNGEAPSGLVTNAITRIDRPKVAFMFTGQGSQYAGMARSLYDAQPTFRAALDECEALLRPYLGQSLLEVIFPASGDSSALDNTAFTQPALFALEYALAKLWMSWGIQPAALIGHSVGEYVAACLAGVFSLEDGLKLIAARARLMGALPAGGQMAAVLASADAVQKVIAPLGEAVSIAAFNGPANTVISGDGPTVQAALAAFTQQGIDARALKVSHAFHSSLMEPMLAEFKKVAQSVTFHSPRLKVVSNLTGAVATADIATADYWVRHVRAPVQFAGGMAVLGELGIGLFLEIGPGTTLIGMGQACVDGGIWVSSLRKNRNDWTELLTTLGTLYTQGVTVDWAAYDQPYARHKLALPTYPFQRERYWVQNVAAPAVFDSSKHPLIGSKVDLAFEPGTVIWQNQLDLNRLAYLLDHRVQDVPVLPATAYMEMAMAAAVEAFDLWPLVLTEIKNHKMIILPEDGIAPTVQVVLRREADSALAFEVYSRTGQVSDWVLNTTGKLLAGEDREVSDLLQGETLDDIRARCTEEYSGEAFYNLLAEKGNNWGPNFQGLDHLWRGQGEALARIRIPEDLQSQIGDYQFHPAVSDFPGHVLTATVSMQKSDADRGGAFVGGGIDATHIYKHPKTMTLWAYARLRPSDDPNVLTGDVALFDENGALISETVGAHLWYLDHDSQPVGNVDEWFYDIGWEEQAASANTSANEAGTWLVLADQQHVAEGLAEQIRGTGGRAILAYAADESAQMSDDVFHVRPDQAEAIGHLIEKAAQAGSRGIIHLWSLDAPAAISPAVLGQAQQLGSESILYVVRAAAALSVRVPPRLWIVTAGVHAVNGATSAEGLGASPVWGLGRTIAAEHSELWGGLVDLEAAQGNSSGLWQAIAGANGEDQLVLRGDARYVARLTKKRVAATMPMHVRPDGTYLITGGLGGLGLQVARWLVEKGARRLILMGRTPIPARGEWNALAADSRAAGQVAAIRELEMLGASIHLAAVDVADEASLRAYLDGFQSEGWPPIRGVVHAAGTMQYQSLRDHSVEAMRGIFAPKVQGSWLLHSLLADAPLDFFVTFSSTSALLSSPLMGSYAAANTFMDALAHYRQQQGLPALSINWGTWADVGMVTNFEDGDRAVTVAGSMSSAQGLDALDKLMHQEAAQVGVMPINWQQWKKLYPAFTKAPFLKHVVGEDAAPASTANGGKRVLELLWSVDESVRQTHLQDYLSEQVASVLGFPPANLDIGQSVVNLGMDSLMAVELKNRIEKNLNVIMPMVKLLQGPSTYELTAMVFEQMDTEPQHENQEPALNWEEGEL